MHNKKLQSIGHEATYDWECKAISLKREKMQAIRVSNRAFLEIWSVIMLLLPKNNQAIHTKWSFLRKASIEAYSKVMHPSLEEAFHADRDVNSVKHIHSYAVKKSSLDIYKKFAFYSIL